VPLLLRAFVRHITALSLLPLLHSTKRCRCSCAPLPGKKMRRRSSRFLSGTTSLRVRRDRFVLCINSPITFRVLVSGLNESKKKEGFTRKPKQG
jgi:hypothetical protein